MCLELDVALCNNLLIRIKKYRIGGESISRITVYSDDTPIFECYNVYAYIYWVGYLSVKLTSKKGSSAYLFKTGFLIKMKDKQINNVPFI